MKNIILVVLALIVVGLLVLVVDFNQKANKFSKKYEEEKFSRLVAEESLQKSAGKLATLENQLKSANSKLEKVQDLIDQEKGTNQELRKEFESLTKLKADLEEKLKSAIQEKSSQVTGQLNPEVANNEVVAVPESK